MNRIDLYMFDLDGTLIDTKDDLAASVNFIRARGDLPAVSTPRVLRWVGDGASILVARALGIPEEMAETSDPVREGLAVFREHYTAHMLDQAHPYAGVVETLDRLRERGHDLAVVSNKPAGMCVDMLERLDIADRFVAVLGGDSLPVRKPDPTPLLHLLAERGVPPDRAVMVGDGTQDMIAGRAAGVTTVAAVYGFRSREELEPTDPDHWIESPAELCDVL